MALKTDPTDVANNPLSPSEKRIVPVMVGTAGHVDHGKTSLVKNLTGFDTDALPEEKERGVSIDFRVAPYTLPNGSTLGIIDVPGHEDFIRNMVAGASSIDILMLVVAADDGIMPQTEEHIKIVQLLGMSRLLIVVTKIDLVDSTMKELLREELSAFALKHGFKEVSIIFASNTTGEGISELHTKLGELANEVERDLDRCGFRMDVRHVFSVKGHGTVVTGIPRSGIAPVGTELVLMPDGLKTGVRGVQSYRTAAQEAEAHISSAINLRDLEVAQIHRGMTLAVPELYEAVTSVVVSITNVTGDTPIRKRTSLRVHSGTAAVPGSLRLLDCDVLAPAGEAFAHLRFSAPIVLSAGDKLLLRSLSPALTIGGARVLSVDAPRPRKLTEQLLNHLISARSNLDQNRYLSAELLSGFEIVFSNARLLQLTRCLAKEAQVVLQEVIDRKELIPVGKNAWCVADRIDELRFQVKRNLERYHHHNRFTWGMKPQLVCDQLSLPMESFVPLSELLAKGEEIAVKHGRLALASFSPQIDARQIKLREEVLLRVGRAGINTVARGPLKEELGMTDQELKQIVRLLVDEGEIASVGAHLLTQTLYDSCRDIVRKLFSEHKLVELAHFREQSGASRNIATEILDSFDAEGLTRRTESGRIVVSRAERKPKADKPS